MFQVLLVDDEPLVHQHVGSLPGWIGNGFEAMRRSLRCGNGAADDRTNPASCRHHRREHAGHERGGAQRAIGERFPSVKTIMLSSYDDYDYVRECLKNGAADYLLKHRLDGGTLMAALRKAVEDLEPGAAGRESGRGSGDGGKRRYAADSRAYR